MAIHLEEGVEALPGYRIVRKLGQGGFGEVWEAEAPGGVHIALKFIRLGTSACAPELRALDFIRNIRHPHLLDIQFTVQRDEFLIIATPLCDESLWDRLSHYRSKGKRGLPREELLENMEEVAKAIDFLNDPRHPGPGGIRIGIQHRDIKPHNIFLAGGCARLADFGLAKVLEKSQCSHTGSMTPSYIAPEVLQGFVTPFSDQYSLAVTYCQLRSGELPFQGEVGRVMYGHIHEPPDLSALPPDERPIVSRALAKKPEERWPNCQAFVKRLRETPPFDLDECSEYPGDDYDSAVTIKPCPTTEVSTGLKGWRRPTLPHPPVAPAPASDFEDSQGSESQPAHRPLRNVAFSVLGIAALFLLLVAFRPIPPDSLVGQSPFARPGKVAEPGEPAEPVAPPVHPDPAKHTRGIELPKPKTLVVQVHPPTAGVTIDEEPVRPDPAGRIELPWTEAPSHEVVAKLKGYRDFRRHLSRDEVSKAPFHVRLEPEVEPLPPRRRPFRGIKDVLAAIKADLRKTPEPSRRFQRYFSFTNLHNDVAGTTDEELRVARTALANVINGLSRGSMFIDPAAIDEDETILKIDVRDLGWDKLWQAILREYPYGVKHDNDGDIVFQELAHEVYDQAKTEQPYVRADWFVATAPHPPLRDALLGPHKKEMIRDTPESVEILVRRYTRSLGVSEVAGELGIADVKALATLIKGDPELQQLGLTPLSDGGRIEREDWRNVFDQAVFHLNLGIPYQAF